MSKLSKYARDPEKHGSAAARAILRLASPRYPISSKWASLRHPTTRATPEPRF
jgi:hypothetical protein